MKKCVLMLCLICAGCTTPGFWYDTSSGKRADATPQLIDRLAISKTICNGEASATVASSSRGALSTSVLADRVFNGCMARQGFIIKE